MANGFSYFPYMKKLHEYDQRQKKLRRLNLGKTKPSYLSRLKCIKKKHQPKEVKL